MATTPYASRLLSECVQEDPQLLNLHVCGLANLLNLFGDLGTVRLNGRRLGLHIVKTFQLLLEDVHGELDTLKVSVTLTLGCLLPEQECLGDAHCGREVDVGRRVGRIPDDEQVFIDPGVWLRLPR